MLLRLSVDKNAVRHEDEPPRSFSKAGKEPVKPAPEELSDCLSFGALKKNQSADSPRNGRNARASYDPKKLHRALGGGRSIAQSNREPERRRSACSSNRSAAHSPCGSPVQPPIGKEHYYDSSEHRCKSRHTSDDRSGCEQIRQGVPPTLGAIVGVTSEIQPDRNRTTDPNAGRRGQHYRGPITPPEHHSTLLPRWRAVMSARAQVVLESHGGGDRSGRVPSTTCHGANGLSAPGIHRNVCRLTVLTSVHGSHSEVVIRTLPEMILSGKKRVVSLRNCNRVLPPCMDELANPGQV